MNHGVALPLDQPEMTIRAAGGSLVRRSVLSSGVRILSEEVPGARSVTVGFWVAAGSRDEQPGRPSVAGASAVPSNFGSTHFLEHLLFKGTRSRSALDIAVSFDSVGGEHNALTAKEHTCYYAKIQDRDLSMAVEVIADMVTSSRIDADEFETERGVILEELAMADDDPADVASERLFEAVFGEHPLGRPIGGTAATIREATRDAVWSHYRAAYRPCDLVVSVAGAVDHNELVSALERVLAADGWDLKTPASPVARRVGGSANFTRGTALSVVHRPTEQANLFIGVPGIAAGDERRMTMGVLNSILGGGMSSRLFQEVREKRGLAYSVYSFAPSYSDAGLFGLYAACAPSKAGTVAELLLAEFRRLADGGVSPTELSRAQGQLSGAAALALEDSDMRMSRLARAELTFGEFVDLDESLRRLARVNVEDVQDLAAALAAGPASISVVGAVDESTFAAISEKESAPAI
ncbi:M16 family metallopeptidase [Rathayibacter toxicus]|uniref:Insulinase family protein n=2 Tax=Rathayibacter toxicus TaxID=145458 RepID=A0A2S5Y832_9MICO|nr:pitrilysin family protein [Rathayibacter toxicus]AJM78355.1 zinc protease [Rathayibacter toxicus]ALS58221.1 zinc protease [Rathayibacter toxicus]PPG22340.1 insulinase family protein [Rathayibacter toxicus]PPG47175.1 insulinase family protein [Rathayibacter toxicus]PPH24359.1 insulinase family protein [Rathayibacter toxicus]